MGNKQTDFYRTPGYLKKDRRVEVQRLTCTYMMAKADNDRAETGLFAKSSVSGPQAASNGLANFS